MEKDKKIKIIPFGEVLEGRMELSKQYNLVEFKGVWYLTQKCRDNYDPISYIEYLQGRVDQPKKANKAKWEAKPVKKSEEVQSIFGDMIE
jgi:hypothetical protein